MATTIQVAGPTQIIVNRGGENAANEVLGYSDNDNLPSITFTDNLHEIKTVLSGNVPEEIVVTGTMARISVALVKWDEVVLANLLKQQRKKYNDASVGRRLVTTANNTTSVFLLRVASVEASSGTPIMYYDFPASYLVSDGVVDSQWGNRERVMTLNFHAIPKSTTVNNVTTTKLFDYVNAGFTAPT